MTKRAVAVLTMCLLLFALVGCGNSDKEVMPQEQQEQQEQTMEDFPFVQLGNTEGVYTPLEEDHPEVVAVKEFMGQLLNVTDNFDYQTATVVDWYPFMSPVSLKLEWEEHAIGDAVDVLKSAKMVSRLVTYNVPRIVFNNDFTQADIDVSYTTDVLEGDEEILAGVDISLGKTSYDVSLALVKVNEKWRLE